MKYVLMWSTVQDGCKWLPYSDTPEGRKALLKALSQVQSYGPYLLYWKVFREDTAGVFAELTKPKGGDNGGVEC